MAGSQVLKRRRTALERAEKFLSEPRFPDCNLRGRWEPDRSAASSAPSGRETAARGRPLGRACAPARGGVWPSWER
uniref:Uncharacterized protein n=1 Tax=Terrapene triunguis TaxID=2587831 RepID=A0A674JPB4_9SAUR